ncbi:MAG: cytochrome C, partial [Lentisphaeraceae bacterium]|nr:cytochrome C [Lentisphaeraceae bacterium]
MIFKGLRLALASLGLFAASTNADWYDTYDYSQVSSQVLTYKKDDILRGNAVKMGQGDQLFNAYYDTGSMNLRYVGKGKFRFNGAPWKGSHRGNSHIEGELIYQSSTSLAWAYNGSWEDPRDKHYAPLPAQYIKSKGNYRHGDKVIYRYIVGDKKSTVCEMPHMQGTTFQRHFYISQAKEELLLKLIDNKDIKLGKNYFINAGKFKIERQGSIYFIRIPAGLKKLSFVISYSKNQAPAAVKALNINDFTRGGALRWPQIIAMKGQVNDSVNEHFAVDQIPIPSSNPWKSNIRFGGFDYFSNGTSAAFCTWNGDVWIASNLDEKLQNVKWKRYAAGLNETLGIRIVDDVVYVTGKEQITRLHDINKDGEADYYENFNNDIKITKNFHEFIFGLQTDAAGNFYTAKASPVLQGGRGFDAVHDNHGVVFKISKDGSKSEVFANGLRAPGGLAVNAAGTIVTTGENEGTYVPACKINYLQKGDFAGVIHGGNGKKESDGFNKPLCYLPMNVDNSGGGQVWVPKGAWGDFGGSLIHLSYGKSKAYSVFKEEVNGQVQGGVVEIPFRLMSSGLRIRFNPQFKDEAMVVGFKGWQTNAIRGTAINRVRYLGKKFIRPVHV